MLVQGKGMHFDVASLMKTVYKGKVRDRGLKYFELLYSHVYTCTYVWLSAPLDRWTDFFFIEHVGALDKPARKCEK